MGFLHICSFKFAGRRLLQLVVVRAVFGKDHPGTDYIEWARPVLMVPFFGLLCVVLHGYKGFRMIGAALNARIEVIKLSCTNVSCFTVKLGCPQVPC